VLAQHGFDAFVRAVTPDAAARLVGEIERHQEGRVVPEIEEHLLADAAIADPLQRAAALQAAPVPVRSIELVTEAATLGEAEADVVVDVQRPSGLHEARRVDGRAVDARAGDVATAAQGGTTHRAA